MINDDVYDAKDQNGKDAGKQLIPYPDDILRFWGSNSLQNNSSGEY